MGAREAFDRDGYLRLGRLLDDAALERVRGAMDREARIAAVKNPYGVLRHNPWTRHPALREVLWGAIRGIPSLIDCDTLILFQDILVSKPPGTTDRVEWHQDFAYWPLSEPLGVTLWVALDDASIDNGCLHYVPGTHVLGERAPTDFVIGAKQDHRADLPRLDVSDDYALPVPISAREALAHHPLVWHMSPANRSTRPRRAWSISLIDPSVRWDPAHAPHPFNHELAPVPGTAVVGALFRVLANEPEKAR